MEDTKKGNNFGFPCPAYRFDQKNDMFKRSFWEERMRPYADRYYKDIKYQDKAGFKKLDYALRNAAWNLEWAFGFGNWRGNSGLYKWDGVVSKIKPYIEAGGSVIESPEEMSRIVKKAGLFLGADLVGICKVHPNWIYSHEFNKFTMKHYPIDLPKGCDSAIVMAVEMSHEALHSSPSAVAGAGSGLGYSKMAFVANLMATFIRGLGYRAVPSGNDTALSVPLAMAAGLGEGSRSGLLITEKFGSRVRICKVFTDLPLNYDHFRPLGVAEFCKTCKKCAVHCPAHAIPFGDMTTEGPNISSHSGNLKWYIDAEKCYSFWAKNRMDCVNCIRVCPFNKAPGILHDAVRLFIRKTTLFNHLCVWMDSLMGYGRYITAKNFWDSH